MNDCIGFLLDLESVNLLTELTILATLEIYGTSKGKLLLYKIINIIINNSIV